MYITEADQRCIVLGLYLVEHNMTVRAVAKEFGISKSTVHKDVTVTLRKINRSLPRNTTSMRSVVSLAFFQKSALMWHLWPITGFLPCSTVVRRAQASWSMMMAFLPPTVMKDL